MRQPRLNQLQHYDTPTLAAQAAADLLAPAASVSPKFFYDALGSRLFDAITELDEYYPTRTEAAIMAQYAADMVHAVHARLGPAPCLIDLGAGNCAKARRLFPALQPTRYVAVDISADYLRDALANVQRDFPSLDIVGLGLDFSQQLQFPPGMVEGPGLVFYPGSSIGNFDPPQALRLLVQARAASCNGALLIGVDLVKDAQRLVRAYDDPLGVTAAFNLNVLRHLNRLLGADFQLRDWQHLALFNSTHSRIEMHLVSKRSVAVHWNGGQRTFAEGERLHTENSYKWQAAEFEALLRSAGYTAVQCWTDPDTDFAVLLAT